MKITRLRNVVIRKAIIFMLVMSLLGGLLLYILGHHEDFEKKLVILQNEIRTLTSKLDGLNRKTVQFSEAVKIWENMSGSDRKLNGLSINEAKEVLEEFRAEYNITDLQITFSKPSIVEDENFTGEYVALEFSEVSLKFSTISDQDAFKFINIIRNNLPGMIEVKLLTVTGPMEVSRELLEQISKGQKSDVIKVAMDFTWFGLKQKK